MRKGNNMTVNELQTILNAENLTPSVDGSREISCGYACDLLSWVMAHGQENMAWVTVQTHMNVIAVAVLADMACVIMPENIQMEAESIEKAEHEGLTVLKTALSSYGVCAAMAKAGISERG